MTYRILCDTCRELIKPLKSDYNGETARMAKTRAIEHMDSLRRKEEESVLWTHTKLYHNGIVPDFKFEITGTYVKKPLQRQLMEAVRIENSDADVVMNSKNEWMLPLSVNVRIERGSGLA